MAVWGQSIGMPQAGRRRAAVDSGDPSPPGRARPRLPVVVCHHLCTGAVPHSSASRGRVLSRSGQVIAELQVQLFQQHECVYYLSTCLQAPTPVFTFYLLKFYWCFQLRNWFSFPLFKQPQNRVYAVSDCEQLSWSTPKAAPLW